MPAIGPTSARAPPAPGPLLTPDPAPPGACAAQPDNFGELRSLQRLGLKSNQLVQLPGSFTQLAALVELFITDTQLEGFPQGMGNMRALVKLQASFNRLKQVGCWAGGGLLGWRWVAGGAAGEAAAGQGLAKLGVGRFARCRRVVGAPATL